MSEDILEQVIADIKASPITISLQLDESTDVSNCSQLIAVVRYVKNKKIEESFLFCQSLETTTKAKDVFHMIKEFFMKHQLHLDKIGSIYIDGAPAMLGNRSGFAALLRNSQSENYPLLSSSARSCSKNITSQTEESFGNLH